MRNRGEFAPIHQVSIDRLRWESAAQLVQMLDGPPPTWQVRTRPPEPPSGPTPTLGPAAPSSSANLAPAVEWYYVGPDRQQVGPVSEQAVRDLLRSRQLSRNTLACKAGETRWDPIGRHRELAPFAPAGISTTLWIAGSAGSSLVAVAILVFVLIPRGAARDSSLDDGSRAASASDRSISAAPAGTGGLIKSITDEKRIDHAVGFVVCGWTVHWIDGDIEEISVSSGSCFAVTADGYLVTNRHVIEDQVPRMRMAADYRIADYCNLFLNQVKEAIQDAQRKGKQINAEAVSRLLSRYKPGNYQSIEPKVWVFFSSKDEMYEAEILHVSSFDMSVLKISRTGGPYFRMASTSELPRRGDKVYSLGFPGVATDPIGTEETEMRTRVKQKNQSRIQGQFMPADFKFSQHSGEVDKIFDVPNVGQKIEHGADVKHGNSGGPLVMPDGRVVGINTWINKADDDVSGIFLSLAMPQLTNEITKAIERHKDSSRRK